MPDAQPRMAPALNEMQPQAAKANEHTAIVPKINAASKAQVSAKRASAMQLTFNLIIGGLGSGVFTLPWSTAGASVLPAVAIILLVLAMNAWTISIIVEAAERHQTFDLGGLLGRIPGQVGTWTQAICNTIVWFSLYLCLVGYTNIVADSVRQALKASPDWHTRCNYVVGTSVVALPLCFMDQSKLSFTSSLGIAVFVNIFAFLGHDFLQKYEEETLPATCSYGMGIGSLAMVSAMMQAIVIQMCVLPMYAELEDRTPEKFNQIVKVAFFWLFFIFAGFALFGYLAFGEKVNSNVLLDFPSTPWGNMSRLSAAVGVLVVYPILMTPMIAPIRSARSLSLMLGSGDNAASLATLLIVMCVTVTAFYVTDLGFLNVVNGAMSFGIFAALAPGLIGLWLLGSRSEEATWRSTMYVLITVGIIFSILGLKYTDNYAEKLHGSCEWLVKWHH
eukprot:TRINITY_DN113240_c0_g1_i1.p1 TRINITY_DN113240_c0_g1~~TRINITY_DN113240_c0_g1_i1.p1  ORF type:complete len:447 (+),score=114.52 TRINITY_DN113240_c0_g1_i1:151-1491(+)